MSNLNPPFSSDQSTQQLVPPVPEGYCVEDFDFDGITPITWRGPSIHGRGDSWVMKTHWDEMGHTLQFDIQGTEYVGALDADAARELAYTILAALNGELESGNENIGFEATR